MADLNRVFLMGNLTRDPEVRYTPKGTAVGDLSLAIKMVYKTAEGQNKEEVCYVDIVVWGRQAETCKEYLTKGRPIFVEGRLQLDQWETKEGEKKSRLRVRAERIQFLGQGGANRGGSSSSEGGESSGRPRTSRSQEAPAPVSHENFEGDSSSDDDIPF